MTLVSIVKTEENQDLIKQFLLFMKSEKGCRENTIEAYESDLKDFGEFFPNKELLLIKEKDIRNYKFSLVEKSLAPKTVNRKLSVIRTFYAYYQDNEDYEITKNPCRNIKNSKVPKTIPITISESQAETLLNGILLTGTFAIRDHAIFSTFLFTGIRVSELIKLELNDLDFDACTLTVRDGKGGKDRIIPMIPRLVEALKMYLDNEIVYHQTTKKLKTKEKIVTKINKYKCGRKYFVMDQDNQSVFLTKYGSGYSREGIDYLFKTYTKKLGIFKSKLSLHALRRSCLTFLYRQGVDLFILKEISGHAQIQTLQHYLAIDKDNIMNAMTKHPLNKTRIDNKLINIIREP